LIAAGDTYQVNLTFKARFRLEGDPLALYRDLVRQAARGLWRADLDTGEHCRAVALARAVRQQSMAVSSSARPMKGTLRRGRTHCRGRSRPRRPGGATKRTAPKT
jgi:para-aminobenzoate synthetase/4-amino-4-deoxychorismate lyase